MDKQDVPAPGFSCIRRGTSRRSSGKTLEGIAARLIVCTEAKHKRAGRGSSFRQYFPGQTETPPVCVPSAPAYRQVPGG